MSLTCETPSLLIHNVGHKVQASWLGSQTPPCLPHDNLLIPFRSSMPALLLGHLEILEASWTCLSVVLTYSRLLPFPTPTFIYFHLSLTSSHGLPWLGPGLSHGLLVCSHTNPLRSQKNLIMTLITLSYNPRSSYLASPPDSYTLVLLTGIMSYVNFYS